VTRNIGDLQHVLKSPTCRPPSDRTVHNNTAIFRKNTYDYAPTVSSLKGAFPLLMESPGRYRNGQHTLHTPGASDPALCLPQTVTQTVEWTIKEACRLLYTAQFARVLLEDDFPQNLWKRFVLAGQGKFKNILSSRDSPSPQFCSRSIDGREDSEHSPLSDSQTLSPLLSWSAPESISPKPRLL
jgi:hypothetical protein